MHLNRPLTAQERALVQTVGLALALGDKEAAMAAIKDHRVRGSLCPQPTTAST